MKEIKNLRELNPEEGEIIFMLNKTDSSSTSSRLGTFNEYFTNNMGHEAFDFKTALIFHQAYGRIIPITSLIDTPEWFRDNKEEKNFKSGFPVRTDLDGFSRENTVFYKGRDAILNAIESTSHLRPYLTTAINFFSLRGSI